MDQNKDGAAVRGEAVALTEAEIREALAESMQGVPVRVPPGWFSFARAIEKKIESRVSARAADAPSEPSESEAKRLQRQTMQGMADCMDMVRSDLIEMGIIDKSVSPMFIPEAIANYVKSRAADALDQPTPHQNTLDAITGAIAYGRHGTNPPPAPDHWLAEYWTIGQQLAELGKTSAWDNVTPSEPAPALDSQPTVAAQQGSIADDAICQNAELIVSRLQLLEAEQLPGEWGDAVADMMPCAKAIVRASSSRASSAPVSPIAPDGWKLVPIEPTIEMIAAYGWEGDEAMAVGHAAISKQMAEDFKKVIAAAPDFPQREGSEAGNG